LNYCGGELRAKDAENAEQIVSCRVRVMIAGENIRGEEGSHFEE
jgi:hypothetical protein